MSPVAPGGDGRGGGVRWSPAQEALFRLDVATAVSAGAGSGKTMALVELCLRLLSGEATGAPLDPGAIAAITFTDRAAAELEARIGRRVEEQAAGAGDRVTWEAIRDGLDRLTVGTIHSFCKGLLRAHAVEAGLAPAFEVLDEPRAADLLDRAVRAAVVAALDAGRPEARILAGRGGVAGSPGRAGRARGLVDVVAALVRERRGRGERGPLEPAPAAGGGVAARDALLAAAARTLALGGTARSKGAVEAVAQLRELLSALPPAARVGPVLPGALGPLLALGEVKAGRAAKGEEDLRGAHAALAPAAERLAHAAADELGEGQRRELAALVLDAERRVEAALQAARALDFDALLSRARDLLRDDRPLRAELRARLRALLVDEYQDVNGLQQQLLELLAGPGEEGEPPGPILVAVGDPKQSIYGFRGADVAVFQGLVGRLGGGAGRVLRFAENHRSTPAVLAVANEISARALQPPPGLAPLPFELAFSPEDRLVALRPGAPTPACELLADGAGGGAAERREAEARAIAGRIRDLLAGRGGVEVVERGADGEEIRRAPRPGDVAILFRRLTRLAPYERALRAAGVPVVVARGGGFFRAPEVRDLAELLASLADPEDPIAWAALLRSPLCGLADATLAALAASPLTRLQRADGAAAAAAAGGAGADPAEADRLGRFVDAWRTLRALQGRVDAAELLRRADRLLDLGAALLAAPDGERRRANLEKAIALAGAAAEGGESSAELAARWRALAALPQREPEAPPAAEESVTVLTIHQAKGLEWPVVFVADVAAAGPREGRSALLDRQGRLCAGYWDPLAGLEREGTASAAARAEEERARAAESARLLYVALTRARDLVVLSGTSARAAGGWRPLVDEVAAARPDLFRSIAVGAPTAGEGGEPGGTAPIGGADPGAGGAVAAAGGARVLGGAPALAGEAPAAAVTISVTELAEYARCPRRHHLLHVEGRSEPRGDRGGAEDDPGRATARGTLAHAILAELDLAAPPADRAARIAGVAARRGHDPSAAGVRRILADVAAFVDGPAGRALAAAQAAGRLHREVPFLLRVEDPGGPPAYLTGAIDALVAAPDGRSALIIDYKYAPYRPAAPERHRFQLAAYALAAGRALPGAAIGTRLQFLRGGARSVDGVADGAAVARLAREAAPLARAAAAGGGDLSPAALGRTEARCVAEGCGFATRCHRRAFRLLSAGG